RHAQRVQHDIQRTSVRKERHILNRKHAGNDTLVTVTSGHLISDGDLSLLCNVNSYRLVHTRRQLVAVLPCEYFGINYDTVLAVRHLQGRIPYLARLLAEDRTEQSLLSGELCLSLRSHFSDQNIPCTDFCSDPDDSSLIKIFQRIVADTRNISGDLFRSELGVPGLCLILFDMDRSIDVILNQSLT